MFPVLFRIEFPDGWPLVGGNTFPIRMFGIMVILGFLVGTWVISRRLKRQGVLEPQETFDFAFYLLAMGILGARMLYVLQNLDLFRGRFFRIFAIWEGGLVWYGGFALAALFAFWWTSRRKLPVLKVTDACALGLAIGLAVGRLGCFLAGDDYGRKILAADGTPVQSPEHAPWYAIQVPLPSAGWRYEYSETPVSPENFRAPYWLHPAQLYMVLGNLIVFGLLLILARRVRRPGMLTASYLMLYPLQRFVVEFWRGDVDRGTDVLGTGLSFSQFFGLFVVLCGVFMMRHVRSRVPADTAATS